MPCHLCPASEQIKAVRRIYNEWWRALGWIRDGLIAVEMLRKIVLYRALP